LNFNRRIRPEINLRMSQLYEKPGLKATANLTFVTGVRKFKEPKKDSLFL